MKNMKSINLILVFFTILMSCNSTSTRQQKSLEDAITVDSIDEQKNEQETARIDSFQSRIDSIKPIFSNWGFKKHEEKILNDSTAYFRHWWLKMVMHKQYRKGSKSSPRPLLPSKKNVLAIKSIRQFHFIRAWRYVIEEWDLKDEKTAMKWHQAAKDGISITHSLEKPPCVFWRENDKLYFIMSTAYVNWINFSDSVIEQFTERTKQEIMSEMRK